MGKIGYYLWMAFFISLLGWYGWAMLGIGIVLCFIGSIIKCKYDEYKQEKERWKRWQ